MKVSRCPWIFKLCLAVVVFSLVQCTANNGTRDLAKASIHVGLDLEEDVILTADNYIVSLNTFVACLESIDVNGEASDERKVVSLLSNDLGEFWGVENIDAGELESIHIHFCEAQASDSDAVLSGESASFNFPAIQGFAIYAEATATNGVDDCSLIFKLGLPPEVELQTDALAFGDGDEIELDLNIHAAHLFELVTMAGTGCTADEVVEVSASSNADLHDFLIEQMPSAFEITSLNIISAETDDDHEEEEGHQH